MYERLKNLCADLEQTGDRLERAGDRELGDAHRTLAALIRERPSMAAGRSSFRRANGTEVRILDNGRVVHRGGGLPAGVETRSRHGASAVRDLADFLAVMKSIRDVEREEQQAQRAAQPIGRRVHLGTYPVDHVRAGEDRYGVMVTDPWGEDDPDDFEIFEN